MKPVYHCPPIHLDKALLPSSCGGQLSANHADPGWVTFSNILPLNVKRPRVPLLELNLWFSTVPLGLR